GSATRDSRVQKTIAQRFSAAIAALAGLKPRATYFSSPRSIMRLRVRLVRRHALRTGPAPVGVLERSTQTAHLQIACVDNRQTLVRAPLVCSSRTDRTARRALRSASLAEAGFRSDRPLLQWLQGDPRVLQWLLASAPSDSRPLTPGQRTHEAFG